MKDTVNSDESAGRWKKRANIALVGFLLVAAYFFVTEHRAHLSGLVPYLPFLLLLACPLMHVFMHGRHGGHDHDRADPPIERPQPSADRPSAGRDSPAASASHHHH